MLEQERSGDSLVGTDSVIHSLGLTHTAVQCSVHAIVELAYGFTTFLSSNEKMTLGVLKHKKKISNLPIEI